MPNARPRWSIPILGILVLACDGGTAPDPLDGIVEGVVRIEGTPLEGVEVGLTPPDDQATRIGITTADGSFAFEGLEAGEYDVRLGALPDHVDVDVPEGRATLDRSRPAARVDFSGRFKRDASVSVRVVVDGSGVPGLDVALSGPESRSTVTDDDGAAMFSGLLRGIYGVSLSGFDPERLAFGETRRTVEAAGPSEAGLQFSGIEVPRIPDAPTDFSAEVDDPWTIALTWIDVADNEETFVVERAAGPDGTWSALASPGADVATWTDDSVVPASLWRYRLRACNEHGCSAPWSETEATTPEIPPAPPTDLSAGATGPTTVSVAWTDASTNETRFELERRLGTAGAWAARATPAAEATTFVDEGLTGGTAYGYRLRACNDVGCSTWTEVVQVTTVVVPPAAPTGLGATAADHDRIDLAWVDASADETEFRVERSVAGGPWVLRATTGAGSTTFADGTVVGATSYTYRVSACNSAGCSAPSNTATVATPAPPPNLDIEAAYVVQRVQRRAGDVPLVAGVDGLLRVFPRGDRPGLPGTPVRVELVQGSTVIQTTDLAAPVATMPTGMDESSLGTSWNLPIPAALLQPGLGIRITVDPDDAFDEGDETDNGFPVGGATLALDVRVTPPFEVTFVPVRQSANNTVGSVSAGTMDIYLGDARRMMPFADADAELHAEFVTDQPVLASDGTGWSAVLSEVAALRAAEGSSRAYYGVVPTIYGGGVAGIGYIGWPIALGWDRGGKASVAAHEWGHNFGRRHSPGCGAGNADGAYPHAGGRIGAWGYDAGSSSVKSPSTHYDLMTYCGPEWISDYVFEQVLTFRGPGSDHAGPTGSPVAPIRSTGAPVDGLLVWGRVEDERIVLEPAFQVRAPAALPTAPGRFRLEGRGDDGVVFSLSFDPVSVADAPAGEGHFAFVVPLAPADATRLTTLSVGDDRLATVQGRPAARAPGAGPDTRVEAVDQGRVQITWDPATRPMALIRDASTGEILSFARDGRAVVAPRGAEITVTLSDGLGSAETRTARWR